MALPSTRPAEVAFRPGGRPDVPRALDQILGRWRWLERGPSAQWVWHDWNSNRRLAAAVSEVRGVPTPHVQIHRIRQGVSPDPRGSVLWAITRILSRNTPVPITMNYFYEASARALVDREIAVDIERSRQLFLKT